MNNPTEKHMTAIFHMKLGFFTKMRMDSIDSNTLNSCNF
ncbi:unnamed protein product, partial [Vitis vinifera]